jgi:hypothetical protein
MQITESQLIKLTEDVRAINYLKDQDPIMDTDKIRVYHGFSSYSSADAYVALTQGLSGQVRAGRIYSYESGNNPNGLFVTISFHTAKYFGKSGIIIEFDTNATNLEAPVWKGQDSYFVQGQMTQSFKDDEERKAETLRKREKYRAEDPEGKYGRNRISKSDRPELADTLFNNNEMQALFIGNLNPNEIKSVWFNERLFKDRRHGGEWVRYHRKDFLRLYGDMIRNEHKDNPKLDSDKLFKPNDDFSIDVLKQAAEEQRWNFDDLLKYIKKDSYYRDRFLWPKQFKQMQQGGY